MDIICSETGWFSISRRLFCHRLNNVESYGNYTWSNSYYILISHHQMLMVALWCSRLLLYRVCLSFHKSGFWMPWKRAIRRNRTPVKAPKNRPNIRQRPVSIQTANMGNEWPIQRHTIRPLQRLHGEKQRIHNWPARYSNQSRTSKNHFEQ